MYLVPVHKLIFFACIVIGVMRDYNIGIRISDNVNYSLPRLFIVVIYIQVLKVRANNLNACKTSGFFASFLRILPESYRHLKQGEEVLRFIQ